MAPPSGTTLPTYSQSYNYDNLDRMGGSTAGVYTYGDPNHVHAVTSVSSVPNQYAAYDAMGNMTCRNTDTTTAHTCAGSSPTGAIMNYDNEGRLSSWTAPSGTSASETYLYDNEGNQVLTTTSQNGTPTDTVYFDTYTEMVIPGSTTTTTTYYSIKGQRLAEKVGSTLSYLITDLLGNVVMALNSQGTATAVELYEPYGQKNYTWGTMPTAHNYTGQRLDSQSGLLYYNFRWYDPLTGVFVRTDTKQNNAQGFNPYAYVNDNPETKNDPTGHWGWGDVLTFTAIAVAVAVGAVVAAPVIVAAVSTAVATIAATDVAAAVAVTAISAASAAPAIINDAMDAINIGTGLAAASCALSFRSDTVVETEKGEQAIGTLKVGQRVLAYNPQAKKMELEPIQKVWLNHDNDLVDLTLVATIKDAHGKISQQKEVIHTNKKHPFLTKEKGFISVSQLKPGMHILEANGQYGLVSKLTLVPGGMWMYNLTVAQDHTYVVGLDQWIVHNCPAGSGSGNWPGWKATTASVKNLGESYPSVPQVVRNLAPSVAAAQNAAGGRQGASPKSCCVGTFVITDSEGNVVFDTQKTFQGKGTTGGIGGTHAESFEYQAAVEWLEKNAQAGVSYTVNFLNQYKPCDYGGCSTADWNAGLNAAAESRGATASGAFYVMSGTGVITQAFPGPEVPPDDSSPGFTPDGCSDL
jgi:RHS repeat-associated protein